MFDFDETAVHDWAADRETLYSLDEQAQASDLAWAVDCYWARRVAA